MNAAYSRDGEGAEAALRAILVTGEVEAEALLFAALSAAYSQAELFVLYTEAHWRAQREECPAADDVFDRVGDRLELITAYGPRPSNRWPDSPTDAAIARARQAFGLPMPVY